MRLSLGLGITLLLGPSLGHSQDKLLSEWLEKWAEPTPYRTTRSVSPLEHSIRQRNIKRFLRGAETIIPACGDEIPVRELHRFCRAEAKKITQRVGVKNFEAWSRVIDEFLVYLVKRTRRPTGQRLTFVFTGHGHGIAASVRTGKRRGVFYVRPPLGQWMGHPDLSFEDFRKKEFFLFWAALFEQSDFGLPSVEAFFERSPEHSEPRLVFLGDYHGSNQTQAVDELPTAETLKTQGHSEIEIFIETTSQLFRENGYDPSRVIELYVDASGSSVEDLVYGHLVTFRFARWIQDLAKEGIRVQLNTLDFSTAFSREFVETALRLRGWVVKKNESPLADQIFELLKKRRSEAREKRSLEEIDLRLDHLVSHRVSDFKFLCEAAGGEFARRDQKCRCPKQPDQKRQIFLNRDDLIRGRTCLE